MQGFTLVFISWVTTTTAVVAALQQQNDSSRREFLTKSTSSIIAGSTAPLWIPPSIAHADEAKAAKNIQLPPMGMGCWAWGDSLFWGYDPKQDKDLEEVFNYAISKSPPVLLDTAELYGLGRSESLVGEFSKSHAKEGDTIVATKFAALPFRTKPENVLKACQASVKRLGGKPIDLYQIHFPNAFSNAEYWDGMAMAYDKGLIKAVGVSNYGVEATKACHDALAKRGVPLATNQIQYNLLYRYPEDNGLLQCCNDLGIQVLSYSPLALGLLTGKYSDAESVNKIQGPRKKLFQATVGNSQFDMLLKSMNEVAQNHKNSNLPQIAINWCRAKGTIPIPGARNLRQVQSNYGALDWDMSPEEVKFLDQAATVSYIDPTASPFPRKDKDTGLIMFDS